MASNTGQMTKQYRDRNKKAPSEDRLGLLLFLFYS